MRISNRDASELRLPILADAGITAVTLGLVGFSLVMVYSTTGILSQEKFGDPLFFVRRQGAAAAIGLCCMAILSRTPIELLKKISPLCIFTALTLLFAPLIPGVGTSAGGAKRWIDAGIIQIQPAEIAKVLYVVFLAGYFSRHETKVQNFVAGVLKPMLMVLPVAGLLLLQPDFGSCIILGTVTICMALAAGARVAHLTLCGGIGALGAGALVLISPYRMSRVLSFMEPFSDASGKGYQLIQSLIAVGTGQFAGVGLGGSQQKLFFLPAAHTDFIFAVIGEELGFIGCLAVICLFLYFLKRGLAIAENLSDDTFAYCLTVGLTMLIVVPAYVNMGVVLGLLPTKGLVLPLVGYGGSSLVACLCVVGFILALARSKQRS